MGGSSSRGMPEASRSAVVPDLTGLWSCSLLGKPRWWSKPVGGFVLSCIVGAWCLGYTLPLALPYLAYAGYVRTAALVVAVITYPYVFEVKPWPLAARFWLLGAHWFGGCSMSYEERVPDDLSVPQMNCYFPHGIFSFGVILNSGFRASAAGGPGEAAWESYVGRAGPIPRVGLAAGILLHTPLFGHFLAKWTGAIESAEKEHFVEKMKRGESFGLMPGGFHEASLFKYGKEQVYLSKKRGFIKYALQYGYKVVPAYSFGESYSYNNAQGMSRFRIWLADKGLPGICIFGYPLLPWLPLQTPWGIHTIHGKGLVFPKIENPTPEDVDKYHKLFVSELCKHFADHRHRFGLADVELEII